MKYTLDIPEYVSAVHDKVNMHYETEADSLDEAVEELSKHIFHLNKEEIRNLMVN